MSCGQKAWREEAAEELFNERLKHFQSIPDTKKLSVLLDVYDDIQRIYESNISLTKHQWYVLESVIKKLKATVAETD
jgi:hypothetical protein